MDINTYKKRMKELQINQIELAEISEVPLQTIRSIFSGRTPNPRIDTIKAIETAIGLNETTRLSNEFQNLYMQLTESQQEIIMETMRYMVNSNHSQMRKEQWRG